MICLLVATEPNRERVQIGLRQLVATHDERETAWRREAPQLSADIDDLMGSPEPAASADELRIIHGDYFAANLLPDNDTVQIIDWDLAGFGDPAWDLAFLLGAERGVHGH